MQGLCFANPTDAKEVQQLCFSQKLILECCGPNDEVLKLLPPLTASMDDLAEAIEIIQSTMNDVLTTKLNEVA